MERAGEPNDSDLVFDYLIHQATGMIMVQAQLTANEAEHQLIEFAERVDLPAYRVAEDVIARRITFE